MISDDYRDVAANAALVRETIAAACARAGRKEADVALMAVTKFHPVEAAEAAYACGLRLFGESRVQEAEGKIPGFVGTRTDARFEMIGHLQSNKAKSAIAVFSRIQSVDSVSILRELEKRAAAADVRVRVLFELHTGEESKAGFRDLDALMEACDAIASCPHVVPEGLMTMAPYTKDESPVRASFRALVRARDALAARNPELDLRELSMGMTNDYGIAIEEGSTLVRVGTAIFGSRG